MLNSGRSVVRRADTNKPGNTGLFDAYQYRDGDLSLAPQSVVDEYRAVATNRETDWETLLRLSYSRDVQTSRWLSENPSSTADILDIIADVDDVQVRLAVARHKQTVEETLTVLIGDADERVREAAAAVPKLLRSDQVRAAKDGSASVQLALLTNPGLDPFAAEQLRRSQHATTRNLMAERDAKKATEAP